MGFVMTPPKKSTIGRARCSSCEAVCCRLTVVLHAQDAVPDELTTRTPEGLHVMKHGPDGWCVAMNRASMNCGIYESRPSICRRFVMGGAYCKAIRAEYAEQHADDRPSGVPMQSSSGSGIDGLGSGVGKIPKTAV